ncbi:MAG: aspartyl protease [Candidatus Sedimenticola endophacoides]|nr:MAG: aspartyl protease [Candidatus Sedimenticola endophacoides]OQX44427.1 MAG: aspartyl protease [Candidatus Sedimenticola endophacoides]
MLLVEANAREAVLEVDGVRETYSLGGRIGGGFAEREHREVRITKGPSGGYHTVGSINGRLSDMLVDTGASAVAMSEVEARRLGVGYRVTGEPIAVNTASGVSQGYAVTLDRVRVGEIELVNVPAIVIQGSSPQQVLLGMSFLGRVEMRHQGSVLLLREKY